MPKTAPTPRHESYVPQGTIKHHKKQGDAPVDALITIVYHPDGTREAINIKKNPTAEEAQVIAEAKKQLRFKFDGALLP